MFWAPFVIVGEGAKPSTHTAGLASFQSVSGVLDFFAPDSEGPARRRGGRIACSPALSDYYEGGPEQRVSVMGLAGRLSQRMH